MLDFLKKMLPTVGGNSPAGTVNKTDVAKILRDAGIVGAIAAITFLGGHVGDLTTGMGEFAAAGTAVLTMGISWVLRFLKDHEPKA